MLDKYFNQSDLPNQSYLRLPLVGFGIAGLGVALAFVGVGLEWVLLSQSGFAAAVLGVLLGMIGIVVGWYKHGRKAIAGSYEASKQLREKLSRDAKDQ